MGSIKVIPVLEEMYTHDETFSLRFGGEETRPVEGGRKVTSSTREINLESWREWIVSKVSGRIKDFPGVSDGFLFAEGRVELSGQLSGVMGWRLADYQGVNRRENIHFRKVFPCPTVPTSREPGEEAHELMPRSVQEFKDLARLMVSLIEDTAIRPWFR